MWPFEETVLSKNKSCSRKQQKRESQGSTWGVMIRDSQRGFKISQPDSLLSWAFSRQEKKIKIIEVILTLWTLKYVDCFSFSCIDSFCIVHNKAN